MSREELLNVLRKNVCSIRFTKVDGTLREMKCTLDKQHLPVHLDANEDSDYQRKENMNVIAVYDLEKMEWRSFRVDSLIDIQPNLL